MEKQTEIDPEETLLAAAQAGDLATIIATVALHPEADVDVCTENGCTPLILAARKAPVAVGKQLIKLKANVNAANDDGVTALMRACQMDYIEFAKMLLDNKADITPFRRQRRQRCF